MGDICTVLADISWGCRVGSGYGEREAISVVFKVFKVGMETFQDVKIFSKIHYIWTIFEFQSSGF